MKVYIIGNKLDYECFEIVGVCKTLESARQVLDNKIKELFKSQYKNSCRFTYFTKEWKNEELEEDDYEYAISIWQHEIGDDRHDCWYETFYIQEKAFLD